MARISCEGTFKAEHTVAETFEAIARVASTRKGLRIETPMAGTLVLIDRHLPTWAAILGALGIFFFLIGALLWFVRTEDRLTIVGRDVDGGSVYSVTGIAVGDMKKWVRRNFPAPRD